MMTLPIAAEPVPLAVDSTGTVRVGDTRITLRMLLDEFEDGGTAEEIVQLFPALRLADVYIVLGYCLRHKGVVRGLLAGVEMAAEERSIDTRHILRECLQTLLRRTGVPTPVR